MDGLLSLARVLSKIILDPILALLFAGGLLVFLFGVVQFFFNINVGDGHSREDGKRHMFWGIVGMFVMLCAWGIVQLIANTVGQTIPSY